MVICYIAQSLDGFIATADGGLDWLPTPDPQGEDYGYQGFLDSVDGLLLGRRTFEQVMTMGPWPYADKVSRVFTHNLPTIVDNIPNNVSLITQSPYEVIHGLYAQGLKRLWLIGGSKLITSFREAMLIDQYIITTIPVRLGQGIPLFQPSSRREFFCCKASQTYANKITQSHFERV
jgi:dihydrofolate reductase